jgi:hypothetical protein
MRGRDLVGLHAAIEAGAIGEAQWREWADRTMLESPQVPAWLFDLSTATEPMAALAALSAGSAETPVEPGDTDPISAQLGFLGLRHERGEIDLAQLLERAGRLTDAGNYDQPACEAFYLLLNEIDRGGPIRPSSKPLAERAAQLFDSHVRRARVLLAEIAVQPGVAAGRGPRLRSEPRR